MNTDMILPEVHIALQIQSFFVSYLFNFFHFASYSNVFFFFFFQITVSFCFHSPIASWKIVLQHSFLENKNTLLKYSFSWMIVFYIIKANSG